MTGQRVTGKQRLKYRDTERRGEARCGDDGGSTEEKTLTDRGRQTCKEEGEKTKDTRRHGHNKIQHKEREI